ncbi:hypothetical protein MMC22_007754 [Lobaria immixta]|nr:hypothetical protein [Lobaria immixta]
MGLEDVSGEYQASEGKPVTGQNHVASTEDHQELTKYHLGTEQGNNALTAGVTEESSGLAGKDEEAGGPSGVTQGSSGVTQETPGMKKISLTRDKSYNLAGHSGLEQEKTAPSGAVTQEGSGISGIFLTGNKSHNLAVGAASTEQEGAANIE